MAPVALIIAVIVLVILLVLALNSFGMNREYERAVKVDIRTNTVELNTHESVTRDGVAAKGNAVLLEDYFWVRSDKLESMGFAALNHILRCHAIRSRDAICGMG